MNEFEQLARDVRGFATEVRRLGYSSVASGHENQFLELSERMSYVIATPELVSAAATDLSNIGSAVTAANAAAAAPTTGLRWRRCFPATPRTFRR